jgi:hypothetical protein
MADMITTASRFAGKKKPGSCEPGDMRSCLLIAENFLLVAEPASTHIVKRDPRFSYTTLVVVDT